MVDDSFFQVSTAFSTTFSIEFPFEFTSFLGYFSFVSFDVLPAFNLGCMVDDSFYAQLLVMTMCPMLMIGALLGIAALAYAKDKAVSLAAQARRSLSGASANDDDAPQGDADKPGAKMFNKVQDLILKLTFLVYPGVGKKIFQTFQCTNLDNGEKVLAADLSKDCRSAEHGWYMAYAGLMVCVYVIGIPVYYMSLLWKVRKHFKPRKYFSKKAGKMVPLNKRDAKKMHKVRMKNKALASTRFLWQAY